MTPEEMIAMANKQGLAFLMDHLGCDELGNRINALTLVAQRADALLAAGSLTDQDGTVYRTFTVPSALRDDLADALDSLEQITRDPLNQDEC